MSVKMAQLITLLKDITMHYCTRYLNTIVLHTRHLEIKRDILKEHIMSICTF